ncbi:MAG: hypothetical protein QOG05_256, partial [Streptosporangiaceae bacterium]|nr:hypothetical protein [Streptosporangiaceae bacterium]
GPREDDPPGPYYPVYPGVGHTLRAGGAGAEDRGHNIYVDPWGDADNGADGGRPDPPGPAALP